ncbi:hypothetical protein HY571_00160 [Candidatus Micrarchaeota archaeon]|nr:hypothetical protein [Candidatus Micrarchaeota archaeon]
MDLVVDANILFAALVKHSKTTELLFQGDLHLYAQEFMIEEFSKHKEEILEKTNRSESEFFHLLEVLKHRINLVPVEDFASYLEKGKLISPDPNDFQYFALALKLGAVLWSNDKCLKKQNAVKVLATHDIVNQLNL